LIGKAADAFGKFRVFTLGTALSIGMVLLYTHLGPISLPALIAVNAVMFVGIFSRMIPFQALVSSVPVTTQRGSFNAVSASVQQFSGGIASVVAGHIVTLGGNGKLQHFDTVGFVVVVSEFGRTFRENGNKGTDHGHGSVYWVLGGGIAGGRIVGEQEKRQQSTLLQNRDYPVLNNYRNVLGGLYARLWGLDVAQLGRVFPQVKKVDLRLV